MARPRSIIQPAAEREGERERERDGERKECEAQREDIYLFAPSSRAHATFTIAGRELLRLRPFLEGPHRCLVLPVRPKYTKIK